MNNTLMIINILSVTYYTFTGIVFIFILVLLQGLCYVVDITMVFLTFIGIFDFVFHLVELYFVDERGLLLLNLP